MDKKIQHQKNIQQVFVDIERQEFNYAHSPVTLHLEHAVETPPRVPFARSKKILFRTLGSVLCVVVFVVSIFVWNTYTTKKEVVHHIENIVGNFTNVIHAFQTFSFYDAQIALQKNDEELKAFAEFISAQRGSFLLGALSSVVPAIRDTMTLFKQTFTLNRNLLNLSTALTTLRTNGFTLFQSDGVTLLKELATTQILLEDIITQMQSMKNAASRLRNVTSFFNRLDHTIGSEYIAHGSELYQFEQVIDRLITLLESENNRHILLLFQNPSEIRPGGGFLGSYADVIFKKGQIQKIEVRDIYDSDGQLDAKTVPPLPLQKTTENWGARDANWFFDFPTSARTVIDFLETSKIYREENIQFDGAIAVNMNVIQSILESTGHITLSEYKKVITHENILQEIQREVEAGKDKKAGHPKKILSVIAPLLLERLGILEDNARELLFTRLQRHNEVKDIMVFFKDRILEEAVRTVHSDGGVAVLPNDFFGVYLAVVNANIAGGKSDAYMRENIIENIDIDTGGGILTNLFITRTHEGINAKDPWWRETNKDYLQIFTNLGSQLLTLGGNDEKNMGSTINYSAEGYVQNPDLQEIEASQIFFPDMRVWVGEAFQKTTFSTWFDTQLGKTKTLTARYQIPKNSRTEISPGKIFQFIFERQSGVANTLDLTITAPFGYIWKESGSSLFIYSNKDVPGRIIINLTLAQS